MGITLRTLFFLRLATIILLTLGRGTTDNWFMLKKNCLYMRVFRSFFIIYLRLDVLSTTGTEEFCSRRRAKGFWNKDINPV